MKTSAILVAAGSASRMEGIDKLLLPLGGSTVLQRCVDAFEQSPLIDEIIVVARAEQTEQFRDLLRDCKKLTAVVPGGADRQASVAAGVAAAKGSLLAIHDGARPFVSQEVIRCAVEAAAQTGAAAAAVPVVDTVKQVDETERVVATPLRASLRAVQTPQVFDAELYRHALREAARADKRYTDDCQLIESIGHPVLLVPGDPRNWKITHPADLEKMQTGGGSMRIGHGYDVHRLVRDRDLILCGVPFDYSLGLLGHSDADVAVHAAIDAMLGAAAMGDIGHLFPDSDEQYRGADSIELLRKTAALLQANGYALGNLDVTIIAQAPKLAHAIPQMRENLAAAIGCPVDCVSVKATTTERLGFTGRGEGIAAEAVALLVKR